jgi:hypothetical protein
MTPQEIFEYKNRWLPKGYKVIIHSDLRSRAKDWCKQNLDKPQYHQEGWTNVYQDTFHFETCEDAAKFYAAFEGWVLER